LFPSCQPTFTLSGARTSPLLVECNACDHRVALDHQTIRAYQGNMLQVNRLKLLCANCASRDVEATIVQTRDRSANSWRGPRGTNMDKHLSIWAVVLTMLVVASPASAISVADFLDESKVSAEQQGKVVGNAVFKIFNYYSVKKPNKKKADCIMELFTAPSADEHSKGAELFWDRVNRVNVNDQVEGVVLQLINEQCP
jgi:hypothetical protein